MMAIIGFLFLVFLFIYYGTTAVFVLLMMIGFGVVLFINSSTAKKASEQALSAWRRDLQDELRLTTLAESPDYALGWNVEQKRLALVEPTGEGRWIELSRIRAIALEPTYAQFHNDFSETRTARGSQLLGAGVGAAIAGPAGLVVGGLSGKSVSESHGSSHTYLQSLALKLRLRSAGTPFLNIRFSKDWQEVELIAAQIANGLEDRKSDINADEHAAFEKFRVSARPRTPESWWSKALG